MGSEWTTAGRRTFERARIFLLLRLRRRTRFLRHLSRILRKVGRKEISYCAVQVGRRVRVEVLMMRSSWSVGSCGGVPTKAR